jgi:alpha 1,3-glucosidase
LTTYQVYYNYFTNQLYRGAANGKEITVSAKLHEIALFRRGGTITPTQERPRRASTLMRKDPYTLTIALSKAGNAKGELYMDDGDTFSHEKGDLIWRGLEASTDKKIGAMRLVSRDLAKERPAEAVNGVDLVQYDPLQNSYVKSVQHVRFEKIVVLGLSGKPKAVKTSDGKTVQSNWTDGEKAKGKKEGVASVLVIKDPGLLVSRDWELIVEV